MPDREKVITHLMIIHTWAEFARERDLQFFTAKHLENIAQWSDDALALLKEQEPVKPIIEHGKMYPQCGNCGEWLLKSDKYCSACGKKVLWQ